MEVDFKRIQELVERPGESLSIELKTWIYPLQPDGIAKIVKTAFALRNYNGGYMIFGFNNQTLQPDSATAPADVKALYHPDIIQAMVAKYASEPFEIAVEYPERNGQVFPVIVIPAGVKTPVIAKSRLQVDGGKILIQENGVYVRTLSTNNTPSTALATWKDWSSITQVCFDNREADIGRFLRRQLGSLTPEIVQTLLMSAVEQWKPPPSTEDELKDYLQESATRFDQVVQQRGLVLPKHGAWEVAFFIVGEVPPHSLDRNFLNLLNVNNPDYTGWPIWLDSRRFAEDSHPYVFNGQWEACVISLNSQWSKHIDFYRINPKGRFYARRGLEDDLSSTSRAPEPGTVLDFVLPILRSAEAIAVGIAFAKAMGCDPEKVNLAFVFRWTGLSNRQLSSWTDFRRFIPGYFAHQDEVISFTTVPLNTPLSALTTYVEQVVQPLLQVFGGFTLDSQVFEDLVRRLVERRL